MIYDFQYVAKANSLETYLYVGTLCEQQQVFSGTRDNANELRIIIQ